MRMIDIHQHKCKKQEKYRQWNPGNIQPQKGIFGNREEVATRMVYGNREEVAILMVYGNREEIAILMFLVTVRKRRTECQMVALPR